jgi:hypothetical protein
MLVFIDSNSAFDILGSFSSLGGSKPSLEELRFQIGTIELFEGEFVEEREVEIVDEDGNKITEVRGIRSACKIMKTRYSKPFESVQVKIPYETGLNPYSGLVDLFEGKGLLQKDGNSLKYVNDDGVIIKQFRKAWERNEENSLDTIMSDISNKKTKV